MKGISTINGVLSEIGGVQSSQHDSLGPVSI